MANWELIARQIVKQFGVGTLSVDDVRQTLKSIMGVFPDKRYQHNGYDDSVKSEIYMSIYTIGNMPDLGDPTKEHLLRQFLKYLNLPSFKTAIIDEILIDAGLVIPTPAFTNPFFPPKKSSVFKQRNFHAEIITHCERLFIQSHYFHSIHEACKAYNNKVRDISGLNKDGADLMQAALSKRGVLKVNRGSSTSHENEQEGIMFLSSGLMKAFRNPTAHETAQEWLIEEQDCLDILSFISFLFRKIEKAELLE